MFIDYLEAYKLMGSHKLLVNGHPIYLTKDNLSHWLENEKGYKISPNFAGFDNYYKFKNLIIWELSLLNAFGVGDKVMKKGKYVYVIQICL